MVNKFLKPHVGVELFDGPSAWTSRAAYRFSKIIVALALTVNIAMSPSARTKPQCVASGREPDTKVLKGRGAARR